MDSYNSTMFNDGVFENEISSLHMSMLIHKEILKSTIMDNINTQPDLILDLGCGLGESSLMLSEIFPNSKVVGLDREKRFLQYAKKNNTFKQKVSYIQSDIFSLPFSDNSIDICFTRYTCQHLSNLNDFFKEVKRVLKPSGIFMVVEVEQDLNLIIPTPKESEKYLRAEALYKKIIKNDRHMGRNLFNYFTSSGFKEIFIKDVSIDNNCSDIEDMFALFTIWKNGITKEHPYILTKRISYNELLKYHSSLLDIIKDRNSFCKLGNLFVMGVKE